MVGPANVTPVGRATPEPELSYERDPELRLWDYIEPIRRRRSVLGACLAVTLAVAVIGWIVTPPAYRATTVLQVERRMPNGIGDRYFGWDPDWQSFYPTQKRLLESRGLAERVVKNLRLEDDPAFGSPSRGSATEGKAITAEADAAALGSLAQRLQAGLGVELVADTQLITISYESPSPELAARIVNGVADAFIDWGIQTREESAGQVAVYLATQVENLKGEIQEKEAQLQAYSLRTDIVNLDPASNDTLQRLDALNRQYTSALSERIGREARYKELLDARDETVAEGVGDALLGELRLEQFRLEREYATRLTVYKPDWPAMQQLATQIEKGRTDLARATAEVVGKVRDAARADFLEAQHREQSLKDEMARQKSDAMQLNSASVEYNNLRVEVSTRRALLDDLLKRQSALGTEGQIKEQRVSNVVVVDRALEPRAPFRPLLQRNLQIGVAAGLFLGIALIFLLEHLDRSIKEPEEVGRVLGVPLLAVIPAVRPSRPRKDGGDRAAIEERAVELAPHLQPRQALSESYRSLRTALLLSTAGGLRSVVVTSGLPEEGKTTTAVNLAVVLAQLDRKVLIIDGDLRRPRLHEVLSCSNRTGLVSYLTGSAAIDQLAVATQVPNLSLVTAGPSPPNPSELLSSGKMRDFLAHVIESYDHVVIDSPPLLPVTDPIVLGQQVDGLVLCIGAGSTRREDAAACVQRLAHAGARLLGAVLNRYESRALGYRAYDRYAEGEVGEA